MQAEKVLPHLFTEKLYRLVGKEIYRNICKAFTSNKPTTFRVNRLKSTSEKITSQLDSLGISYTKIPWNHDAFMLKTSTDITSLDMYKTGHIYVQSLSSMIPVLILEPKPGEKILDITAAPGSKTTQIASIMDNTGMIVANDNSPIRLYKLKANLELQGVTNCSITHFPGQRLWQTYPEYFNRTLVDVPCSMEGRFNIHDNKTYTHWTPSKVKELSEKQKWILRSAISATKPDGIIVYSTCTLSPEENEDIIEWIIKKEHGAVMVDEIPNNSFPFDPAIGSWNGKTYIPEIAGTRRIHPSKTMEGFYIAKLRKVRSTIPSILRQ